MKLLRSVAAFLAAAVLFASVLFLLGRYGWKLGGFRGCESAAIEQVQVEEGRVRIRGFYPGSFPQGFLGYHAEQADGVLYVGFKFSGLFGIFETGDFDITVPTDGTVTQVVIKTADSRHVIWPSEDAFVSDEPEAGKNGIYIRLERADVYAVGWYFENKSGGMTNADGTALGAGEDIWLDNDVFYAAANLERTVPVMLTFSDGSGNTIAQVTVNFDPRQRIVRVVLTAEGKLLVNGRETEAPTEVPAYAQILARYRTAVRESWDGQQLVDAGLNLILRDLAPENVGYAVEDLDGNGAPELAIATVSDDGFYGKMVLELFTLDEKGEAVSVFSSAERNRFYYAGGNRFANLGSSGAADSFETTLKLESGELTDMTFTTPPEDYVQMKLTAILEDSVPGTTETNGEMPDASVYIGSYLDGDSMEPNLQIGKGEDGKYIVQIGIFRLTFLDDGVGELTREGLRFTATDAAGNPISGIITVEAGIATVTFTDSTWPLLENGTVFTYQKCSDVPRL